MSGKPDSFMPLYLGDYLRDTSRLTTAQHGAYLLLIMDSWANGPPPDDDGVLSVIVRTSLAEWKRALRPAVVGFFKVLDGRWTHSRIEKEQEKAKLKYERRRSASKVGNEKRWGQQSESPPDSQSESQSDDDSPPNSIPIGSQPQPQPHSSASAEETTSLRSVVASRAATRWPSEAVVCELWLAEAAEKRKEHGLLLLDLRLEAEKFVNYWSSKSGRGATKADWRKTWINWALNAEGRRNGSAGHPNSAHSRFIEGAAEFVREHYDEAG